MKIDVIAFDEESGVITLELDEEAKQMMMQHAVNDLLRRSLIQMIEEKNGTQVSDLPSN